MDLISNKSISINQLPTEVLLEIFDNLPLEDLFATSLVCQSWYEIVNTSVLHLKTVIRIDRWNHKDLVACLSKLEKKYVDTTFTTNYEHAWREIAKCTRLPRNRETDDLVARMFEDAREPFAINHEILKELNVPYMKDVKTLVFDDVKLTLKVDEFLKIIGNLKHLKTLHLLNVDLMEMNWAAVTTLPDECSIELDILEYFYSYGLRYNQLHNANMLPLLLYFFKRIKKLSLNMEWHDGDERQLDFLKICAQRAEFVDLYELNIRSDSREQIKSVTNYLPLIENLNVRELTVRRDFDGYIEKDSVYVQPDFKILPTLEKLNILEIMCTAEEVEIIVAHAPNIQELHIGIDTGSKDVLAIFENFKNLKCLKKLGIHHWKKHKRKPPVLKINSLLEMEQLELLCFGGQVPILFLDVATLSTQNFLGNLKTFQIEITRDYKIEKSIAQFDKTTEATLKFMLRKMKNLEKLLFDTANLSDDIWKVIVENLHKLEIIMVCTKDEVLKDLKLPALKCATIHDGQFVGNGNKGRITEVGLKCIPQNWPNIQRIEIDGDIPLSDECFEYLRINCEHIRQINNKKRSVTNAVRNTVDHCATAINVLQI